MRLGLAKNENPARFFIIEEPTDLVEEAVLLEFERITERVVYLDDRNYVSALKIQEESMHYEMSRYW